MTAASVVGRRWDPFKAGHRDATDAFARCARRRALAQRGVLLAHWRVEVVPDLCHHGVMDLRPYIDEIHRQLEAAAETGGEDARALAQRIAAPLDAAIRLSLLDALSAAVQEITCDLAPGSVELRLRGRDPEFVVTAPAEPAGQDPAAGAGTTGDGWSATPDSGPGGPGRTGGLGSIAGDEGAMARVNLRMPDHLKARVDRAAAAEGLSVNAWLVRAAASALERADPSRRLERRGPLGPQRLTGWAR